MGTCEGTIGVGCRPNYDKRPVIAAPGSCAVGWDAIAPALQRAVADSGGRRLAVDCYSGVRCEQVLDELRSRLRPTLVVGTQDLLIAPAAVDALVDRYLGGDDPIFGYMSDLSLEAFFDPSKLDAARQHIASADGLVLIIGVGAAMLGEADVLVYADMPRWEEQLRQRRGETANLGVQNHDLKASLKYKRSYFVDWRVLDRWKRALLDRADFFLDTTIVDAPKLASGGAVRDGLRHAVTRPFRVVPFFDPGPWGGQWMRRVCGLDGYSDPEPANYAWCFDCVPEENSLLLGFGDMAFELPSLDLLYRHPAELLGEHVRATFGDEFPIRFDFLDTMGGGNLSFQVHPLKAYIREHFGLTYTQDESYYLLDAGEDGTCYLGVKPGVDVQQMRRDLETAQNGGEAFDASRYANQWPARRHDHFLIPAGTVHCSGKDTMVLEISATPYIFTFKLWDWGRLGLDGKPRPINIDRGFANIQWDRDADFCARELINWFQTLAQTDAWTEERTGLHPLEFIETRRHWFTGAVPHDTGGVAAGGVHVLNLVEGREAVVESPDGLFAPFVVHYAETFIIPAAVGRYTIRPHGESAGKRCATIKAYVRHERSDGAA